MKTTFTFLLLLAIYGCEKSIVTPQQTNVTSKQLNHGNHFGNSMRSQDSACAMQTWYQFPPLPSDSIFYPHIVYSTGIPYDTLTSTYTIAQSGNYTVEASAYRYLTDSTDLKLFVNGSEISTTGLLFQNYFSFVVNVHLFNGDEVNIRTSTAHTVEPNGVFKIKR